MGIQTSRAADSVHSDKMAVTGGRCLPTVLGKVNGRLNVMFSEELESF